MVKRIAQVLLSVSVVMLLVGCGESEFEKCFDANMDRLASMHFQELRQNRAYQELVRQDTENYIAAEAAGCYVHKYKEIQQKVFVYCDGAMESTMRGGPICDKVLDKLKQEGDKCYPFYKKYRDISEKQWGEYQKPALREREKRAKQICNLQGIYE